MTGSLVIAPTGGLCNRLRVLFSYLAAARASAQTLQVHWKVDPVCVQHFLDVFYPIPDVQFLSLPPAHVDYRGCAPGPGLVPPPAALYAQLVPRLELAVRVSELAVCPYDAAHVRRTDHVTLAKRVNKFMPLEVFEQFIADAPRPVYLACDDRDTQQALVAKYPDKLFVHQEIARSRQLRQTALRHAVIDLFTCVGAEQFLGTEYSSFTGLIKILRAARAP
jgi:hypothetical protein